MAAGQGAHLVFGYIWEGICSCLELFWILIYTFTRYGLTLPAVAQIIHNGLNRLHVPSLAFTIVVYDSVLWATPEVTPLHARDCGAGVHIQKSVGRRRQRAEGGGRAECHSILQDHSHSHARCTGESHQLLISFTCLAHCHAC